MLGKLTRTSGANTRSLLKQLPKGLRTRMRIVTCGDRSMALQGVYIRCVHLSGEIGPLLNHAMEWGSTFWDNRMWIILDGRPMAGSHSAPWKAVGAASGIHRYHGDSPDLPGSTFPIGQQGFGIHSRIFKVTTRWSIDDLFVQSLKQKPCKLHEFVWK